MSADRAQIAALKTTSQNVIDDYKSLMHLAEYQNILPKDNVTIIKLNLSWTLFYPACSTPPWQLEGVLKTLREDGYDKIIAVENQTVVTHPWKGAFLNKWLPILKKYDVEFQPLTNVEWVTYQPNFEMLAMNEIFHTGILVPKMFFDSNVIHLPTMKTHGHTVTTGAMKNAFGGLIPKYRHHAHRMIHEILVDLLAIQKEIHRSIFAVMDGCVCGNGAGPRTMEPVLGNMILAGEDQVAIDATAARIMGFDPSLIDYIRISQEKYLGNSDRNKIEILGLGDSVYENNMNFKSEKSLVITWDQILRKRTVKLRWLHDILFHSPIFKTFIFASGFYHDRLWYPLIGEKRITHFNKTEWGRLFHSYSYGQFPEYNEVQNWNSY